MSDTFKLPPLLEEDETPKLYQDALAIDTSKDVTLDASEIERIKTPAVQILLSLQKTIESAGNKLIIAESSDYFNKFCGILGARSLLPAESTSAE